MFEEINKHIRNEHNSYCKKHRNTFRLNTHAGCNHYFFIKLSYKFNKNGTILIFTNPSASYTQTELYTAEILCKNNEILLYNYGFLKGLSNLILKFSSAKEIIRFLIDELNEIWGLGNV